MKSEFTQVNTTSNSGSVTYVMAPATRRATLGGIDFTSLCHILRQLNIGTKGTLTMMNLNYSKRLCLVRCLWIGALAACLVGFASKAGAATSQVSVVEVPAPTLDAKHLWALGMLETGNNDREIGGAGEISRYQILPVVWKSYSGSRSYNDPEVSLQVARLHWNSLAAAFKERTGRQPGDFDMYVLWNTGCGYYAKKGFDQRRIAHIVQDRAQRFVNLVNRRE
jgi:hypothetical protein